MEVLMSQIKIPWTANSTSYRSLASQAEDEDEETYLDGDELATSQPTGTKTRVTHSVVKIILVSLLVSVSFFVGLLLVVRYHRAHGRCPRTTVRREWRELSDERQRAYIKAVQCLQAAPSMLLTNINDTLYDDFAWVHQANAYTTHQTAAFLTWHRRFLYVFEQTLRSVCGYEGSLVYWDWSLDWEDPANSPIWSAVTGFGGNGVLNTSKSPYHCVVDGPFANFEVQYLRDHLHPHCLARDFASHNGTDHFSGWHARPSMIANLLAQKTYQNFLTMIELGAHDIAPQGIRGDFGGFTAPNDPVFYLHHTQLDRLWWLWQQEDPERLRDYSGPSRRGSELSNSTIHDILHMNGLDEDIAVRDVMDTHESPLCYRY